MVRPNILFKSGYLPMDGCQTKTFAPAILRVRIKYETL